MSIEDFLDKVSCGDVLSVIRGMPAGSVNCVITSPPYWGLRNYGIGGQIGLEDTPEEYVAKLVEVFREVRRVMRADGTLWLNLGDSYWGGGLGHSGESSEDFVKNYPKQGSNRGLALLGGAERKKLSDMRKHHPILKPKDLIGLPWKVAIALQEDGWWLRCDVIWHKPNPMPESMQDRPTKSHEYVFLLSKSRRYYYDGASIAEEADYDGRKDTVCKGSPKYDEGEIMPGQNGHGMASARHERWQVDEDGRRVRNARSVWYIPKGELKEAHFATFPEELVRRCILAGCPSDGIVFDPFVGSGTTAVVAIKLERHWVGIELNPEYVAIAEKRIDGLYRKGIQRGFF